MTKWSKTFFGVEHSDMQRPCVYAWFRGTKCLYIGSSGRGYRHMFDHQIINKLEEVRPTDELKFIWTSSISDARKLEGELIRQYKPFYNQANVRGRLVTVKRIMTWSE